MDIEKIVWVIDDHKLRREGTIGVLSDWAASASVQLRQVERPEHIFPVELLSNGLESRQICLLGIGGDRLSDKQVTNKVMAIQTILGDRPLAIISDNFQKAEVDLAIDLGVRGLVSTFLDKDVAIRAIEFVMEGGSYRPSVHDLYDEDDAPLPASDRNTAPEDTSSAVDPAFEEGPAQTPQLSAMKLPDLSERQMEVLKALKQGLSNKLIARELNLSESTVKIHMRSLIQKFGAKNRTQVALLAIDPALEPKTKSSTGNKQNSSPAGRRDASGKRSDR